MIEFFTQFVSRIPIWVPALFCLLAWVGLIAAKEREVPKFIYYLFPLLTVISIARVSTLPHSSIAWSVFFIGTGLGALIGYRLQRKWLLEDLGKRVLVSGEWFTMGAVMLLFFVQFLNGAIGGLAPSVASTVWFVAAIGLIVSMATGTFLGRAIRVVFGKSLLQP